MGIANERFKAIRESLGMTQEVFAGEIDTSVATVRKLERGDSDSLPLGHALKINQKFGYSLDYIYGITDDTNDEASTMLLYLKKLFDFTFDNRPGFERFPYSLCVRKCVVKFLEGYAQAKGLLDNGTIPMAAFEPWVAKLKAEFDSAMKETPSYSPEKLRLVPEKLLEPSTVTTGCNTATPPR